MAEPEAGERETLDSALKLGWLTLVGLVYLLEPGLGLLRASRVRRRAAAGDLVRVPPLHRRQAETKRVMLCSMSSPGGRTKTEATRKRKEIIDRERSRWLVTHHGQAVVGGAYLGGGGARVDAEHGVVRGPRRRLHPAPLRPAHRPPKPKLILAKSHDSGRFGLFPPPPRVLASWWLEHLLHGRLYRE